MTAPAPVTTAELKAVLRQVKLGRCLDTLPERLSLAKSADMAYTDFLELVLSDEVTRRETTSASLRARAAGLDPDMCLENWDLATKVNFDHQVWDELCSLRFIDAGHNALVLGPGWRRQDLHGNRARPCCGPPTLQRDVQPHRRAVEAPPGLTPRQQPRRRDQKSSFGWTF
jgi:IstB-like ATP binding protein